MLLALSSNRMLMLATLIAVGSLTGCTKENSSDVAIAAAQACLDQASTSTQADACAAKVANIQSSQASTIRCSANLIAQGFTGTRIAAAYQQLKNPSSGTNTTSAMLSYFVFNDQLTNDTAAITNTNCSASGDSSLTGIGNLVNTASIVANFYVSSTGATSLASAGLDPSNPSTFNAAQLESAVTYAYSQNSAAVNQAVGQLAITAASAYCSAGSSMATQSVCVTLNKAVTAGDGDTTNTGYSLLNLLQN